MQMTNDTTDDYYSLCPCESGETIVACRQCDEAWELGLEVDWDPEWRDV